MIGGVEGDVYETGDFDSKSEIIKPNEQETVEINEPTTDAKEEITQKPIPSSVFSELPLEIESKVVGKVAEHTGYPEEFLEFDQDFEGELGIDTVKQAEIMGDIRSKFSLPVDEEFVLSEHPTLNHMNGTVILVTI